MEKGSTQRAMCSLIATCFTVSAIVPGALAAVQHTVSIQSDGRDEIRISNGSLVVEHFSWSLPANLTVDGSPKPLTFNGNTSTSTAVPINGDYWVKKTKGRDGGYAVQRSDGFALTASDNPVGSDIYEFQLSDVLEANIVEWMRVVGAGGTPGRMSFTGLSGYSTQPLGTELTFSLTIDGTDELMFVNGNLVIKHVSRSNPTALTINGVPQPLTFTGNLSNPISLSLPGELQFLQLSGRTTLSPVQTPVGLLIGASDELTGADTYTWKVVSVPEPTSVLALISGALALLATRRTISKKQ
jgi:hypothetical protein